MAINNQLKFQRIAFSGMLFGVLLLFINPNSAEAFQVDSLQQTQTLEGLNKSLLRFADYDNDGDLDIIVAGQNSSSTPTTKLYKNDSNGTFIEDTNNNITGFTYPGIGWGDIDGDGDLDFAISGETSSGNEAKLYLNNGSAVFTEAGSDPFNNAYWGNMEMADLDGDGDLDIFQTGLQSNGVRVADIFWNDGLGTFTKDTVNTLTGTADGETPLVDVDNDGDIDILLSGYTDSSINITQIHKNNGSGIFTLSQSLQGVASNGIDFGDYDNDGDLDLILTGIDYDVSARVAFIYANDGNGVFSIDATNTIAPISYSNAKWGDYDHDGDLDLILTGFSDSLIRETYIYTNNGSGVMTYTSNNAITGSEEGYVDWADLDGDGFLEVAITGWDGTNRMTKIYQNIRTKSNSTPSAPMNVQYTVNQDTLTFTWDATSDTEGGPLTYNIFWENTDSSKTFYFSLSDNSSGFRRVNKLGNKGFVREQKIVTTSLPKGNYQFGVQAIDGAGKGSGFTTNSDYKKTITSGITSPSFYSNFHDPSDIAWIDIDNDGDLDLLDSYSNFGIHVYAYINNGNGALSVPTSGSDRKVFAVGQHDRFTVNYDGFTVEDILVQSGFTIDYGDIDNDGDVDIVIAGRAGSSTFTSVSLYIFTNDGSGNFTNTSSYGDGEYLNHASLEDIDLDGDLDILALGYRRQEDDQASSLATDVDYTKVLLNDGTGSFTASSTTIGGLIQSEVFWFDHDEDGDKDVIVSGWEPYIFGNGIRVQSAAKFYINDGSGGFTESTLFQNLLPKEYNIFFYRVSRSPIIQFNYDDDNDLDLLYVNRNGEIQAFQYSGNGAYSHQSALTSTFSGTGYFSITAVDIDSDGNTDLIASKINADSDIYINQGSGIFQLSTEKLPRHGKIAIADYDKDGDLDFAVHGNGASPSEDNSSASDRYMSIIENNSGYKSGSIGAPTNLSAKFLTADRAELSWTAPLSTEQYQFNVFFKNKSTGTQYAAAASDTSNGFKRINHKANSGYNSFFVVDFDNFTKGEYEWGVQAIGADLRSSVFAKNTTDIAVGGIFNNPPTNYSSIADTSNEFSRSVFPVFDFYRDSSLTLKTTGLTSGFLFIDTNNNQTYDVGEAKIDSSSGGVLVYNSSNPVRLKTESSGIDSFKLFSSNSFITDSTTITHVAHKTKPSFSGTANEGGWYLLTNPLNTTLGNLFENIWTQGAINADSESGSPNLYTFNPDSAKYVAITTDLDTTKVSAGEGILAYIFPDDNYNDSEAPVNGGWPKVLSNYGNPFGENISIPVKNVDTDGNGSTSGSEGFMLMGNPYGFAASVDSIVAELVKIDPLANRYIYRWDPIAKQYNLSFSGAVDAYESFFVRTIQPGTSGTASLDYNDVHSSARLKIAEKKNPIELILTSGDQTENVYSVRIGEEAKTGIDPFDGYYLGSFADQYSNLYSVIGDQSLSINNLPSDLSEVLEIPLYLHSNSSGEHQLEWKLNNLPENWKVEIEHIASGVIINKDNASTFAFDVRSAAQKKQIKPNKELFTVAVDSKAKGKESGPEFIVRINPGIVSNGEDFSGFPTEVELDQNYPNPFNPSSIIRFGVPNTAKVQLEVFDILGRKVATLVNNEIRQPGRYNIQFNGRNLASGMYIYRLVVGDKVLTKKMTLIK